MLSPAWANDSRAAWAATIAARRGIVFRVSGRQDRISEAFHYARAALDDFMRVGPGATDRADRAGQLTDRLERRDR
jgi:hypothetical protein